METRLSLFQIKIKTNLHHFRGLFKKVSLLLVIPLLLSACDGTNGECIEAEDFDGPSYTVYANNNFDVEGTSYTHNYTSQYADWNDTGYIANGDDFMIEIAGRWTAWYGNTGYKAPKSWDCNMETYNKGSASTNTDGEYRIATDYQQHIDSLDIELPLIPDDQDPCWYSAGDGLYMGLFGKQGATLPEKVYNLRATYVSCDPTYRHCAEGVNETLCKTSSTKWAEEGGGCYSIELGCEGGSSIQDDGLCQDGTEPDTEIHTDKTRAFYKGGEMFERNGGDHTAGEVIKLIVLDRYYNDNGGNYTLNFYQGVGTVSKGMLEYVVGKLEDILLGEPTECTETHQFTGYDSLGEETYSTIENCTGPREGGILKVIYNAISADGDLMIIARLLITLYIAFTGVGFLLGVIKMDKKEVIVRLIKVGFVLVFLGPNTWDLYNKYVVTFFKGGMDDITSLVTNSVDNYYETHVIGNYSVLEGAAQSGTVTASKSGKFAFIDSILENTLISKNAAIKLFSIITGELPLGFIYVLLILFLILFFMYVVLIAAMTYIAALVQLLLVLMLGPIFMMFMMFKLTEHMFKAWIAAMAARTIEVIMLFSLLYSFLLIIRDKFAELLSFRTCYGPLFSGDFGVVMTALNLNINAWKSSFDYGAERSPGEWFTMILVLSLFIYLLLLLVKKATSIANKITVVGGSTDIGPSFAGAMSGFAGFNIFEKKASDFGYALPRRIDTARRVLVSSADTLTNKSSKIKGYKDSYKDAYRSLKSKAKAPFKNRAEELDRGLYGSRTSDYRNFSARSGEREAKMKGVFQNLSKQRGDFLANVNTRIEGYESNSDLETRRSSISTINNKISGVLLTAHSINDENKKQDELQQNKRIQIEQKRPSKGKYTKYGEPLFALSTEKAGKAIEGKNIVKSKRELRELELKREINNHTKVMGAYADAINTIKEEREKYESLGQYKDEVAGIKAELEMLKDRADQVGRGSNIDSSINKFNEIGNKLEDKNYDGAMTDINTLVSQLHALEEVNKRSNLGIQGIQESIESINKFNENFIPGEEGISQAEKNAIKYMEHAEHFDKLAAQMDKYHKDEFEEILKYKAELASQKLSEVEENRKENEAKLSKLMGVDKPTPDINRAVEEKYRQEREVILKPVIEQALKNKETQDVKPLSDKEESYLKILTGDREEQERHPEIKVEEVPDEVKDEIAKKTEVLARAENEKFNNLMNVARKIERKDTEDTKMISRETDKAMASLEKYNKYYEILSRSRRGDA